MLKPQIQMFRWLINWRSNVVRGLLALTIISGFVPQMNGLVLAGWWVEQRRKESAGWQVVRQTVPLPRWYLRVYWAYRHGRAGV